MPMEDFEVQEDLGKGSFGCVVKVVRKSDGEVYAMKQVPVSHSRSSFSGSRKKTRKTH
jgi:serine/threonine protein kinase